MLETVHLLITSAAVVADTQAPSLLRSLLDAYADRPNPRTVAVVGNQPLARDPDRAAAVDACDLVIRVNGFVMDEPGDEPVTGSKVHAVVFNRALRATPWVFRDYSTRLYLMVEPGRLHWEPDVIPAWWPEDLGLVPVSNREITIPLSNALGLDGAQAHWATTGTMAAWIARTMYPDAHLLLTGYSFIDNPNQTSWEHASGDSCIVGPEHQIAAEGRLLASWVDSGSTTLMR
ncbi:hypothetical protein EV186_101940 [Labedaea rhizosphaerae]|uniref:Glycosyl transferase family 29 (Putative sialyltransferase) n=1 Tax=Labedaea rhizosphaerae TaxID=598644 RepID=A0A4R6SKN5_LABRH|nr:hypothetical protein EV186_101940 [Labedaea rhizosphaerae]